MSDQPHTPPREDQENRPRERHRLEAGWGSTVGIATPSPDGLLDTIGAPFPLTMRLGSAGFGSYRVPPEEPSMTFDLVGSGDGVAMSFGLIRLILTFRDAFPQAQQTGPDPSAEARVQDLSRGREVVKRKGRGPKISGGRTP